MIDNAPVKAGNTTYRHGDKWMVLQTADKLTSFSRDATPEEIATAEKNIELEKRIAALRVDFAAEGPPPPVVLALEDAPIAPVAAPAPKVTTVTPDAPKRRGRPPKGGKR